MGDYILPVLPKAPVFSSPQPTDEVGGRLRFDLEVVGQLSLQLLVPRLVHLSGRLYFEDLAQRQLLNRSRMGLDVGSMHCDLPCRSQSKTRP
jgi:hypothetical protein